MFLLRDVLDKQLVDRHGDKAGRVDDLLLELRPGERPVVRAIMSGHGAEAPVFPRPIDRLVHRLEEWILGLAQIQPATIDWEHVQQIDVVVHLDLDRRQAGLVQTEETIWHRWLKPLPWSRR